MPKYISNSKEYIYNYKYSYKNIFVNIRFLNLSILVERHIHIQNYHLKGYILSKLAYLNMFKDNKPPKFV